MTSRDGIPAFAMLTFPPFPRSHGKASTSYVEWETKGIWIPSAAEEGDSTVDRKGGPQHSRPVDSYGDGLIDLTHAPLGDSTSSVSQPRLSARGEGGVLRLPLGDCFKLGQEGSGWVEPDNTGRPELYDISRPPFDRIMTATRDFLQTRNEAFQFHRTKRLFDAMRYAFGLKTDLPGRHWPGSGEAGHAYQPPRSTVRLEAGLDPDKVPQDEEVCMLLRNPEDSLRGYVALLRRETESGWDLDPTIKLAEIIASFFAYIDHHSVFADEPLASRFKAAAHLASRAPRQIREANRLEVVLAREGGLNRESWMTFGGQYGTAERRVVDDDADTDGPWPVHKPSRDVSTVQPESASGSRPADQGLESLIHPLDRGHVKLLGHIPYARRRVTAVLPSLSDPSLPAFQRRLYRLITVPAPWTEAEAWRRLSTDKRQSENDNFQNPLEGEETTIAEPDELAIWVESDAIPEGQADRLVGMGLRGRWGLFGAGQDEAWWAFTTKDYVLPALWYSGGDEAQERD